MRKTTKKRNTSHRTNNRKHKKLNSSDKLKTTSFKQRMHRLMCRTGQLNWKDEKEREKSQLAIDWDNNLPIFCFVYQADQAVQTQQQHKIKAEEEIYKRFEWIILLLSFFFFILWLSSESFVLELKKTFKSRSLIKLRETWFRCHSVCVLLLVVVEAAGDVRFIRKVFFLLHHQIVLLWCWWIINFRAFIIIKIGETSETIQTNEWVSMGFIDRFFL